MDALRVRAGSARKSGHRIAEIPLLYLGPHSNCDCRCTMCDVWKGTSSKVDMSVADLERHLEAIRRLKVRKILLSGGEPLEHPEIEDFCRRLKREGLKIVLFTNGMLIESKLNVILESCDQLIVSLDGDPTVHDRIRQRSGCASQLASGIKALLSANESFPITARTVVQKLNCDDLHNLVRYAYSLRLRGISFLAADVSSTVFNRPVPWDEPKISQVALSHSDLAKLSRSIELLLGDCSNQFLSGFVRSSPAQMWDIYRYYKALLGLGEFPAVRCRAPWESAMVDPDGTLRPCFLHKPYGTAGESDLLQIISSPEAKRFRRDLRVSQNAICRRCVFAGSRLPSDILV